MGSVARGLAVGIALGWTTFSNSASADALSNAQVVVETPETLIVRVDYEYDTQSGDCVRVVVDPGISNISVSDWPARPGSGTAFLRLRHLGVAAIPSSSSLTFRMVSCDAGVGELAILNQPTAKTWSPATNDHIEDWVQVTAETPAFVSMSVLYTFATSHAAPVQIRPRVLDGSGSTPFAPSTTASGVLPNGVGVASIGVGIAGGGPAPTEALILEMREDGGPVFWAELVPMVKQWSINTVDSDSDGIADAVENLLGTNPASQDTDSDGLQDGWELEGYRHTDGRIYPEGQLSLLGADPRHKDVFVEIDYVVRETVDQRMHIDSILKAKELFENTAISNPDGDDGFALHVIHDDPIAERPGGIGGVCGMRDYEGFFALHTRRIYHWAITSFGSGGQAPVGGNVLVFATGEGNPGMGEFTKFTSYALLVHELGHNLGLRHGGVVGTNQKNCKPNYFSLMNYAYDYSFGCSPYNLDTTQITFSRGNAPSVNLNSLDESAPPIGLDLVFGFDSDFLGCNAFDALISPYVIDWNQNGTYDAGPVSVSTSAIADSCGDEGAAANQNDSDDYATMSFGISSSIESPVISNCDGAGPSTGYMVHPQAGQTLEPFCGVYAHTYTLDHPWVRDNPVLELRPGVAIQDPHLAFELAAVSDPQGITIDFMSLDEDDDQIPDFEDNCLGFQNFDQQDEDQNGIGTGCNCGDANQDGKLDLQDVDELEACLANPMNCGLDLAVADVDNDGEITLADVDRMQSHLENPVLEPAQNLICERRPIGLSPVRFVPEPNFASAGRFVALVLWAVFAIRGRTRETAN